MKKRIITVVSLLCLGCTIFAGCAKENTDRGDFYPYKLESFVELGEYWDIDFKPGDPTVTDKDVDEKIKSELERLKQTTKEIKEGAIVNGDTANIDYKGYSNGQQFDGGTAEGYYLKIGSGSFIDGFEEGLVGKKAGEEVRLNLKFPNTYHEKTLAGKEVIFDVKINSVTQTVYPELTDELCDKISSAKTVKEYKQQIYDNLVIEKADAVHDKNVEGLVSKVIENCNIRNYPKKEVEYYINSLKTQYKTIAGNNGLSLEAYLAYSGYSMEAFDEIMETNARNLVSKEMVFLIIAEKEGIKLTEEDFEAGLEKHMKENNQVSRDLFLEKIGEDKFRGILLIDKTIDYMISKF